MDKVILPALDCAARHPVRHLDNETTGGIINRLSIPSLKIFHWGR